MRSSSPQDPNQDHYDTNLALRTRRGDPAALLRFENCLAKVPALAGGCHRRLGSPLSANDLEDVVQEACLTAWQSLESFRGEGRLESWLYGIVRLCILGRLRAQRVESPLRDPRSPEELPLVDERWSPAGPGTQEVEARVHSGVEGLGGTLERIIRRRHLEGRSFETIGTDLQMPAASVKSRYYRSLPRLRILLAPLEE